MSNSPKMPMRPIFPAAVLADTALLTHEQKGVLNDLENNLWMRGGWLPADDKIIAHLLRLDSRKWKSMRAAFADRLLVMDEKLTIKALLTAYNEAVHRSEENRINGKKGGNKRQENMQTRLATGMPTSVYPTATEAPPNHFTKAVGEVVHQMGKHT